MGHFYVNFTLKGPTRDAVAAALRGREAFVASAKSGAVVVWDEESEEQDLGIVSAMAKRLSAKFACPVLAALNHDDDVLWLRLYEAGKLADTYDSTPGYFDGDADGSGPEGGDAARLCAAFWGTDAARVEAILRRAGAGDEDSDDAYVFEVERHLDLVRALGLPEYCAGTSFEDLDSGEYPSGTTSRDFRSTED